MSTRAHIQDVTVGDWPKDTSEFLIRFYGDTHLDSRKSDVRSWIDFEIFEVLAMSNDDQGNLTVRFYAGEDGTNDMSEDLEKAWPICSGFVKWDGCTQFNLASVHVDHHDQLDALFHAIQEARQIASTLIIGANDLADEYNTGD